jgi:murein DD-endopeptidase MepM/ murein hydrolase activator NlpD
MTTTFRTHKPLRRLLLLAMAPAVIGSALAVTAPEPAVAGPPGTWTRPTTARYEVSSAYGTSGTWQAGHHTGVDLAVPIGTRVRSVGSGTVVLAAPSGDYGNAVTIRMADGNYTLFGHLSRITAHVGQKVRAGTPVGYSGDTGRSSGPHLHFEVRAARSYGSDIDPRDYLARHGVQLTM